MEMNCELNCPAAFYLPRKDQCCPFHRRFCDSLSVTVEKSRNFKLLSHSMDIVWRDCRRSFGFDIGFIDHFNTRFVIPLNYSDIANIHTLSKSLAHTLSFPSRSVFDSCCLVTASNNDYSSASGLEVLSKRRLPSNFFWYKCLTLRLAIISHTSQAINWTLTVFFRLPYRTDLVRVTLRLAVYGQSVRLGDKPLETHDRHLFFHLNTCFHSPYVTSSLTRGWIRSL
jgi:hypothetical protein